MKSTLKLAVLKISRFRWVLSYVDDSGIERRQVLPKLCQLAEIGKIAKTVKSESTRDDLRRLMRGALAKKDYDRLAAALGVDPARVRDLAARCVDVKKNADQFLDNINAELIKAYQIEAKSPGAVLRPAAAVGVAAAVDRYLAAKSPVWRSRTLENYQQIIRDFARWCISEKIDSLDHISDQVLRNYRAVLLGSNSIRTCKSKIGKVGGFLRWCRENQLIDTVPNIKTSDLKYSEKSIARLTRSDIEAIALASDCPDLIRFAYLTGLRRSELCAARFSWVIKSPKGLSIRVQNEGHFQTKSGKSRVIPLAPAAAAIIESMRARHLQKDNLIFLQLNGKPFDKHLSRYFARAVRRAKMDHRDPVPRLHDLRHNFAIDLLLAGVNIRIVQDYLGHKDIKTTMIYLRFTDPESGRSGVDTLWD
jgi:integrase